MKINVCAVCSVQAFNRISEFSFHPLSNTWLHIWIEHIPLLLTKGESTTFSIQICSS